MRTLSSQKRILVTGASRGIGRGAALALAAGGHQVILAARDAQALETVATEIRAAGGQAEVLPMDVTDDASVAAGVKKLLWGGPCDVVVNNAGSCAQAPFLDQRLELQRAEMELNYWGAVRVARAMLPSMIARRQGVIVNVSSLLGSIASPTTANYGATKAALESWTFALRREVAGAGVQASVFVAPHTDTGTGQATRFDGVKSLPIEYTVRELLVAIDRAPRRYAASPVYRFLLRLHGFFPHFMEGRVAASAPRLPAYP